MRQRRGTGNENRESMRPGTLIVTHHHGEHIVLLNSDGKLAALFLLEIVENWTETGRM
jgi:hypothetical protein